MSILNMLFEEDIEMQDAIEDIAELNDNSEDIIIGSIEDRFSKDGEVHLFAGEENLDDDGLTDEEEHAANVALLNMDSEEGIEDEEQDDAIDAITAEDEEEFIENL